MNIFNQAQNRPLSLSGNQNIFQQPGYNTGAQNLFGNPPMGMSTGGGGLGGGAMGGGIGGGGLNNTFGQTANMFNSTAGLKPPGTFPSGGGMLGSNNMGIGLNNNLLGQQTGLGGMMSGNPMSVGGGMTNFMSGGMGASNSSVMQRYDIAKMKVPENKAGVQSSRENIYFGDYCHMPHMNYKETSVFEIRLADYSLMKNLQVPDEVKPSIRKALTEGALSLNTFSDVAKQQLSQISAQPNALLNSTQGLKPFSNANPLMPNNNIFGTTNNIFTNNQTNQTGLANAGLRPNPLGAGLNPLGQTNQMTAGLNTQSPPLGQNAFLNQNQLSQPGLTQSLSTPSFQNQSPFMNNMSLNPPSLNMTTNSMSFPQQQQMALNLQSAAPNTALGNQGLMNQGMNLNQGMNAFPSMTSTGMGLLNNSTMPGMAGQQGLGNNMFNSSMPTSSMYLNQSMLNNPLAMGLTGAGLTNNPMNNMTAAAQSSSTLFSTMGNPMVSTTMGNPMMNTAMSNPMMNSMMGASMISPTMGNPSMTSSVGATQANLSNNALNSRSNAGNNLIFSTPHTFGKGIDDTYSIQDKRNLLNSPWGLNSLLDGNAQNKRETFYNNRQGDLREVAKGSEWFEGNDRFNPFGKKSFTDNPSFVAQKKNQFNIIVKKQITNESRKRNELLDFSPLFFIKPKLEPRKDQGNQRKSKLLSQSTHFDKNEDLDRRKREFDRGKNLGLYCKNTDLSVSVRLGSKYLEFDVMVDLSYSVGKFKAMIFREKLQIEEQRAKELALEEYSTFNINMTAQDNKRILEDCIQSSQHRAIIIKINEAGLDLLKNYGLFLDVEDEEEEQEADESSHNRRIGYSDGEYEISEDFSKRKGEGLRQSGAAENRAHRDYSTSTKKVPEWCPILTKEGYKTSPSLEELRKMSRAQLEKVDNFSVENEFGKVEFDGLTDVTYLNLDEIVDINKQYIEVYNDEIADKPVVGLKLNKPATLTFKQCLLWNPYLAKKKPVDHEKVQDKLEKQMKQAKCKLIHYNPSTGCWMMRVEHFTKYFAPAPEELADDSDSQSLPREEHHNQMSEEEEQEMGNELGNIPEEDSAAYSMQSGHRNGEFDEENSMQLELNYSKSRKLDENRKEALLSYKVKPPIEPRVQSRLQRPVIQQEESDHVAYKQQNSYQSNLYVYQSSVLQVDSSFAVTHASGCSLKEGMKEKLYQLYNRKDGSTKNVSTDSRRSEGLFNFPKSSSSVSFNNLPIFNKNSSLPSNIASNKPRLIHPHLAFRVGWTKDGFSTISKGRNECFLVHIHKMTPRKCISDMSFNKKDKISNNFERSRGVFANLFYRTLFEGFLNKIGNDITSELSKLEIKANREDPRFPKKEDEIKFLKSYYYEFYRSLEGLEKGAEVDQFLSIFNEEMMILNLYAVLFSDCNSDLSKFVKKLKRNAQRRELKPDLLDELPSRDPFSSVETSRRNKLIGDWLKLKAQMISQTESVRQEDLDKKLNSLLNDCRIFEATKLAHEKGRGRLAQMASSFESIASRCYVSDQHKIWKSNERSDQSLKNIYSSFSLENTQSLSWVQKLGQKVWFNSTSSNAFPNIFFDFLNNDVAPIDIAFVQRNSYIDAACILFYLYASSIQPNGEHKIAELKKNLQALHSLTLNTNPLSKKLLWILFRLLKQNKRAVEGSGRRSQFNIQERENSESNILYEYRLTRNFVAELESIGLWDLALIVILVTDDEIMSRFRKRAVIEEIVSRNSCEHISVNNFSLANWFALPEILKSKKLEMLDDLLEKTTITGIKTGRNLMARAQATFHMSTFNYPAALKVLESNYSEPLDDYFKIYFSNQAPKYLLRCQRESCLSDIKIKVKNIIKIVNEKKVNLDDNQNLIVNYMKNIWDDLNLEDIRDISERIESLHAENKETVLLKEQIKKETSFLVNLARIERELASPGVFSRYFKIPEKGLNGDLSLLEKILQLATSKRNI